jgi:thiol-disulfide isomerase/thioredoxin
VVKIYFGSWCPHCREHVPFLLRVEDEVKNPKIQFQYYGLPRDFNDPEAKRLAIKSVPTGIIYVGGREVGRLAGAGWSTPEVLLSKILAAPTAQVKNSGK